MFELNLYKINTFNFLKLIKLQFFIHYFLHLIFPAFVAYYFFRENWKKAWLIMLATMFIDLDHLLANPIYDANRCSVNFHLLHQYWAIPIYVFLLFFKKTRIVAIGLLMHILTDLQDCMWQRF